MIETLQPLCLRKKTHFFNFYSTNQIKSKKIKRKKWFLLCMSRDLSPNPSLSELMGPLHHVTYHMIVFAPFPIVVLSCQKLSRTEHCV